MAKSGRPKKTDADPVNGGMVFEKMELGFEIPARVRTSDYDDLLDQLKAAKGAVVCVFKSGDVARACNTRRKSLLTAAGVKGMDVRAAVRNRPEFGGNVLLAQYNGELEAE